MGTRGDALVQRRTAPEILVDALSGELVQALDRADEASLIHPQLVPSSARGLHLRQMLSLMKDPRPPAGPE